MNVSRTNLVLAGLLCCAVFFAATIDVDRSRPNFEFLPQMKRSAASNAWSESTVFPNGRTMQAPVPGTIARGDLPLHFVATKEDAVRAGEELRNPFALDASSNGTSEPGVNAVVSSPDDVTAADHVVETEAGSPPNTSTASDSSGSEASPIAAGASALGEPDAAGRLQASVQRGAAVYSVFCVSCHGPGGAGDGPVARRGFPPPPPLPTGKSVQMKDGQLFHILSYGQGSMAPMAAQLSRDRRWDVINFVRSLQQDAASTPSTFPGVPADHIVPSDAPSTAEETRP